ncbi:MAG: hypothetical protein IJP49_02215 [Bacteroidales bacterium]|nr:hypothetical protein [Bacteroidales bacterium]
MKKTSSIILCVAIALIGCTKTEVSEIRPALVLPETAGIVPGTVSPAPIGEPFTFFAGFAAEDQTRSRLELDPSAASVLWTAGDSFRCLFGFTGNNASVATFSTSSDGTPQAAFTTYRSLTGSEFYCFYPDYSKWGKNSDGDHIFGINLPFKQHAKAGGIEEGLNRAFAYADGLSGSPENPLVFYNMLSLLKFRMDGAIASQVREITFIGSASVAGDFVIKNVDGVPTVCPEIYFNGSEQSSKVILSGDFKADTDYYIALKPGQLTSFRMEFSDGAGRSTLKQSSKALTLERSRIKDFGTIHLGNEFVSDDSGFYGAVKYMSATEGTKPVTIVVIPEGFTKEELSTYEQLAHDGLEALFDTEPYKTYRNRFNVYILKVPSTESGASVTDGNGSITKTVLTHFNARWGQNTYGDMTADQDAVFSFVQEFCPDIVQGIHTIEEVPIMMIINDARYGGICSLFSNGRGFGMIPHTFNGGGISWSYPSIVPTTDDPLPTPVTNDVLNAYYRWTTQADYDEVGMNNGDWRNTLVHEFGGHCFGRLGDEYWQNETLNYTSSSVSGQNWPVPMSLNLTSTPASAPWKAELLDRLDALTAIDSHYNRIGTFQGGDNYLYGRWRSEKISCMIDNRFYFSAWQRYLITKRIFTLSGDLDRFSFESWLAKDVTADPVRDLDSETTHRIREHRTYTPVGPLPPPVLTEVRQDNYERSLKKKSEPK